MVRMVTVGGGRRSNRVGRMGESEDTYDALRERFEYFRDLADLENLYAPLIAETR